MAQSEGMIARLRVAGAHPVSAASAAFFRIAFGIAVAVNAVIYMPELVHEYYVAPDVFFGYGPIDFVEPLPGVGMYFVYAGKVAAGLLIALGLRYRWAAAAFFVLTTYVFLLDSTYYQNHEYLISMIAFLMIFLPVNGMWSLDARRGRVRASTTVPAWVVWLLRFQIGVPYFYGGLAKLNSDWLAGEPLRMWLDARTDIFLVGPIFGLESVVMLMAIGGLVFDLTIVPLLLYRRTRVPAFCVAVAFHLTNAMLFGLFIFPWLMIAATTIFFDPDWPLRALRRIRGGRFAGAVAPRPVRGRDVATAPAGGAAARPAAGAAAAPAGPAARAPGQERARAAAVTAARMSPVLLVCLAAWMSVQLTLPFRHFTVAGSPSWTEESHRFSWHMRLRDKKGSARFTVRKDGREFQVDPSTYLTPKQNALLAGYPERIVKFARHLSDLHGGAEVYAETSVSLNGRPRVPIVDPEVDLAAVGLPWPGGADWILPLDEPL